MGALSSVSRLARYTGCVASWSCPNLGVGGQFGRFYSFLVY